MLKSVCVFFTLCTWLIFSSKHEKPHKYTTWCICYVYIYLLIFILYIVYDQVILTMELNELQRVVNISWNQLHFFFSLFKTKIAAFTLIHHHRVLFALIPPDYTHLLAGVSTAMRSGFVCLYCFPKTQMLSRLVISNNIICLRSPKSVWPVKSPFVAE